MSVKRAFVIIGVSGIAFAIGGASVGYALGRLSPSYYRAVFASADSPDFDPAQAGLGLGLTQGCIAGLIIGSVVVLAVSISGQQRPDKSRPATGDEVGQTLNQGCLKFVCILLAGSVMSLPIGLGVGLIIGALGGEYGCKKRRFSEEGAIIAPVLAGDPITSHITMDMYSADGTALLYGELATKEDLDRLQARMTALLGESRIKELMSGVRVRQK